MSTSAYIPEWLVGEPEIWTPETLTGVRDERDWESFYGEHPTHKALNNLEIIAVGHAVLSRRDLHKEFEERMKSSRQKMKLFWPGLSKEYAERMCMTPRDIYWLMDEYMARILMPHVIPTTRREAVDMAQKQAKIDREAKKRGDALLAEHGITVEELARNGWRL